MSAPGPDGLDPEDRKLVTLARSAVARTRASEGAAVRDLDGRTYAAASISLPSLSLVALEVAVAMAVSSGARGLEAAALVTDPGLPDGHDDEQARGFAALTDVGGPGRPVFLAGLDGVVRATWRT